jgi:hypothetical protein
MIRTAMKKALVVGLLSSVIGTTVSASARHLGRSAFWTVTAVGSFMASVECQRYQRQAEKAIADKQPSFITTQITRLAGSTKKKDLSESVELVQRYGAQAGYAVFGGTAAFSTLMAGYHALRLLIK